MGKLFCVVNPRQHTRSTCRQNRWAALIRKHFPFSVLRNKIRKTVNACIMACNEADEEICTDIQITVKISESSVVTSLGYNFEPDTGEPITFPFRDLHEVLLWTSGGDEFNVASEPLAQRTRAGSEPLTLMCHDMMGGYNEDRFVQGVLTSDCYRFYHWQYVDMFVYFSHHFVTIPPPGWTNAAHINGVMTLGTVITEWKEGALRCEKFLQGEDNAKALADKLVEIAVYYNFDGWLVNIENPIKLCQVTKLVEFVKYLTTEMHQHKPGSKVIWYDSVIEDGALKWQDMLNDHNSMFFDVTDGIFLNYTWTEEKLDASVKNAGNRRKDVFVGVDVFGRNCYGGGGWDTWKAMKVIRKYQLSAAIFAPAWVFECLPRIHFLSNEKRFWEEGLHPYLHPHGVASLPFVSSFCQGFGQSLYKFGKAITSHEWFNLSSQEIQPTFNDCQFDEGSRQSLEQTTADGYNGGGCLQLRGEFSQTGEAQYFKIFSTALETDQPLLISVAMKEEDGTGGCIVLQLTDGISVVLWSHVDEELAIDQAVTPYGLHQSALLDTTSLPKGLEGSMVFGRLMGTDHTALVDIVCGGGSKDVDFNGWYHRFYLLPDSLLSSGRKIEVVSAAAYPKHEVQADPSYNVRLGSFSICSAAELSQHGYQVGNLSCTTLSWHFETTALQDTEGLMTLCATLSWDYPKTFLYFDVYCSGITKDPNNNRQNIPTSKFVLLGRAYCKCYRLCHLVVDSVAEDSERAITYLVQPTTAAGMSAPFDKASRIRLICSAKACQQVSE